MALQTPMWQEDAHKSALVTDDTEWVEPEEIALLQRLGAAAALAYETAEVVALRERNRALQETLERLALPRE